MIDVDSIMQPKHLFFKGIVYPNILSKLRLISTFYSYARTFHFTEKVN